MTDDRTIMSREIPPAPAWRLFSGKFPMDVQVCALQACMTAFAVVLFIVAAFVFPEPNSRRGIVDMAWVTAFWTYLGCCLYFGDMAVDRQARYELILQEQTGESRSQHHETGLTTEPTGSKGLKSDSDNFFTTSQPQSTDLSASETEFQLQRGWSRRFHDAILAGINPHGYSSQRLTRRFTIACILMIEGLVLLPVLIYLGQKLFLPEDDVEDMATNIPSGSLLFWSLPVVGLSKYGSILQKRKEREEETARGKGKQYLPEPSGARRDEEAGQCD